MIQAVKDIMGMAYKIDELKKNIFNIREDAYKSVFPNRDISLVPLYMTFAKHVGVDEVIDMEAESVRLIVGDDFNADRINAVIATTAKEDVWVHPLAFDMFVDAAVGNEINVEKPTFNHADELAWGIINIVGIEGSITAPFKTDVWNFMQASLDEDGWDIPPLVLFFERLLKQYDESLYSEIAHLFKQVRIEDIYNFADAEQLKKTPLYIANYLIRNQQVVTNIKYRFDKMLIDWEGVINS